MKEIRVKKEVEDRGYDRSKHSPSTHHKHRSRSRSSSPVVQRHHKVKEEAGTSSSGRERGGADRERERERESERERERERERRREREGETDRHRHNRDQYHSQHHRDTNSRGFRGGRSDFGRRDYRERERERDGGGGEGERERNRGGRNEDAYREEREQNDRRRIERREEEEKTTNPFEKDKDSAKFKWGKDEEEKEEEEEVEKEKPNFGVTGKLAADTNTFKGVVIKYNQPPEARKPKVRWRLYPFKGDEGLEVLYIHRQSAYLIGKDRKIADIPVDHPSCSRQHAVLQYRIVPVELPNGRKIKKIKPYVIDLDSANGTFLNNKKVDPSRYYELVERDVLKFGFSSREYVMLHENSHQDSDSSSSSATPPTQPPTHNS